MKKRIICLLIAMIMFIPVAVFSANAAAVKIGAITIDNLREPVAGSTPDYTADVTNGAVDLYQSAHSTENGIIWRKIVNGTEHTMSKTDVFEYGKTYSVRVYVKRQSDEDFFADSIIGKIGNGLGNFVTAQVRKLASDPAVVVVSFVFECNKTAISNVAVSGVTEPVPDSRMSFNVTTETGAPYELAQDGRFVFWVDEKNGTRYTDNQITEFAEGKTYSMQIYLEAKSGYAFPDNPATVAAYVNGHRAELKYDDVNAYYFLQIQFDPCGSLENIELTCAAPVVGQSPSFDQIVNYRYASTGNVSPKTNGISWRDETAGKYLYKGTGQKFESHHVYSVTFELEAKKYTVQTAQGNVDKYYACNGNTHATVNGKAATSIEVAGRDWEWITVKYTFAPLDECSPTLISKKDATCTEKGNVEHYACTCGKLYKDAAGTQEITDKSSVVVPATGHKYSNACDKDCNVCSAVRTPATHKGGTATCTDKAKCSVCGEAYGSVNKANHKSLTTLKAVAATCTKEGKTEGKKCTACGVTTVAQKTIAKKAHNEVKVSGKAATCTKTGLTEGKKCADCGTVTVARQTIKALGHKYSNTCDTSCNTCKATRKITHTYKTNTTKATLKKNGKQVTKCTACGKVSKTVTVYYPKSIKLSATSYTYNGKTKKPTVTVKDSKGKTLKKDTDYTVKYAKGRKAIGKYTVTVTFKGKYSGTKKLSFTIKPKAVTLSKVTAGSKQLTANWKTVAAVTGYEVQASTSSKFTSKTTKKVTLKSAKTKKTTIKKLKKGKKYYVKVRAYKTVGKTKIYSAWSSVKTVKVK